jgi:hypothetical protein
MLCLYGLECAGHYAPRRTVRSNCHVRVCGAPGYLELIPPCERINMAQHALLQGSYRECVLESSTALTVGSNS